MSTFFYLIGKGVRDLFRMPWSLCMTLAAITLVSFLGGGFLLFVHNLDLQIEARQGNAQFQIYWNKGVHADEVKKTWAGLTTMDNVVNVRTFTPDQALSLLAESFEQTVDMDWMKGTDVLPYTALVECELPAKNGSRWASQMVESLRALPGVNKVSFNPLQIDMLTSWVGFTRMIFWPVAGFLLVVVALVVGNTIKLSLLTRREELEILRFIGASRAYIQFPLLIGGAFQGFVGAGLALVLLKSVHSGIADIFDAPPLWLTISFLPPVHCLALVAIPAAVGFVSSMVAVRN